MNIVYFLLIGACAGWLAGQIMKGGSFGLTANLIVGVVGSLVGGFLFDLFGLAATNLIGKLIAATVGAVVLLYGLRFVK